VGVITYLIVHSLHASESWGSDTACSVGDVGTNLVIKGRQRCYAGADLGSECLSLRSAGCPLPGILANAPVGHRQILPDPEPRVLCVFDGVHHFALSGADVTCTTTGDRGYLTQLVGFIHGMRLVGCHTRTHRGGPGTLPNDGMCLLMPLGERRLP